MSAADHPSRGVHPADRVPVSTFNHGPAEVTVWMREEALQQVVQLVLNGGADSPQPMIVPGIVITVRGRLQEDT